MVGSGATVATEKVGIWNEGGEGDGALLSVRGASVAGGTGDSRTVGEGGGLVGITMSAVVGSGGLVASAGSGAVVGSGGRVAGAAVGPAWLTWRPLARRHHRRPEADFQTG